VRASAPLPRSSIASRAIVPYFSYDDSAVESEFAALLLLLLLLMLLPVLLLALLLTLPTRSSEGEGERTRSAVAPESCCAVPSAVAAAISALVADVAPASIGTAVSTNRTHFVPPGLHVTRRARYRIGERDEAWAEAVAAAAGCAVRAACATVAGGAAISGATVGGVSMPLAARFRFFATAEAAPPLDSAWVRVVVTLAAAAAAPATYSILYRHLN
jgi:hypothetical protein